MKKLIRVLLFGGVMLCMTFSLTADAITADKLMNRVDEYRHLQSAKMKATMIIKKGNRELTKKMTVWIEGDDKSLTKFTNPRDRGTKFLKRQDSLWMFFPNAEDIVKISGHMLQQGMMGSDYSYQDMMESAKLEELYKFTIKREEKFKGRPCYVVKGVKRKGAEASYYRRVSWVDKERYVILQEKLYARSGRLLKERQTKKVEKIEGRWFATKSVMEDKLQQNTKTKFIVNSIQFNVDIAPQKFSLRQLRN